MIPPVAERNQIENDSVRFIQTKEEDLLLGFLILILCLYDVVYEPDKCFVVLSFSAHVLFISFFVSMTIIIPNIHHSATVFFSHGHHAATTHHHSHHRHEESAFPDHHKTGNNYEKPTVSSQAKSKSQLEAELINLKKAETTCQKCFNGIKLDAALSAQIKEIFKKTTVDKPASFEEIRKICSEKLRSCENDCSNFLQFSTNQPKQSSSELLIYASFSNRENSSRMNFF